MPDEADYADSDADSAMSDDSIPAPDVVLNGVGVDDTPTTVDTPTIDTPMVDAGESPAPDKAKLARPKVLVIGDENLLFSSGLQETYRDMEFTAGTVFSQQNLELYNFDPAPEALAGRVRYTLDACSLDRSFRKEEFDGLVLFLPGLGFAVPSELESANSPLFAYRVHLFVFNVIRSAKLVLQQDARIHLVWPEEAQLMTSPCGAAGIELRDVLNFCRCRPIEPELAFEEVEDGWFMPFVFGEVPSEKVDWISRPKIECFKIGAGPILVPLAMALLMNPDTPNVAIKDPAPCPDHEAPPRPGCPLRDLIGREAETRRHRLRDVFGPLEADGDAEAADVYGIVADVSDSDSILMVPPELFLTSFDVLPHLVYILRFRVVEVQPANSIITLEMLDPRLPTRIARPPPGSAGAAAVLGKRAREDEEWGGMRFYCPLTKICAPSAERMRLHLKGDLYQRVAASTPNWEESEEKKRFLEALHLAEKMEKQQQLRKGNFGKAISNK